MSIIVNKYKLESPKIKNNINIMMFSDIHNNTKVLNKIANTVRKYKPDYICIPGDIIDSVDNDYLMIVKFLNKISLNVKKIIISIGNHDISIYYKRIVKYKENKDFFKAVKKISNCILLDKKLSIANLENISFSGFKYPLEWFKDEKFIEKELKEYLKNISINNFNNNFNILLSHNPNWLIEDNKIINKKEFPFIEKIDLIMCGHNHAGLVPKLLQRIMPSRRGFVSPYKKFFNKYAYGHWNNNNTSLIISGGITKLSKTTRFFHKFNNLYCSDIELIELTNGKTNRFEYLNKEKN